MSHRVVHNSAELWASTKTRQKSDKWFHLLPFSPHPPTYKHLAHHNITPKRETDLISHLNSSKDQQLYAQSGYITKKLCIRYYPSYNVIWSWCRLLLLAMLTMATIITKHYLWYSSEGVNQDMSSANRSCISDKYLLRGEVYYSIE